MSRAAQTIGILGGMGPRATVQFEQLLVSKFMGNDQSIPRIVCINDGAIPDRSDYILGVGPDPVPRMQQSLTQLEVIGADIVCIPCNTACVPRIFNRLRPASAKLLHLPTVVADEMRQSGAKRIAILATPGTISSGVYQQVCAQNGVDCFVPDGLLQRCISECIALVKQGRMTAAKRVAAQVQALLAAQDVDSVLLACTELPLVLNELTPPHCTAIDTLDVLAAACKKAIIANQRSVYEPRPVYA